MRKLMISVIIVAVAGLARAATYYVDSEVGRDDPSRKGGPLEPWRTVTYALSRVSGENTFICRGTFTEGVDVAYDDNRSTFQGNATARNTGYFCSPYEGRITVKGFDVNGSVRSAFKGYFLAADCHLNHPTGGAFVVGRFYGRGAAENCAVQNCKWICSAGNWEFGDIDLTDCEFRDCESGISISGEASPYLRRCKFFKVGGEVFKAYFYGEGASFDYCEFYDCSTVISLNGGPRGYWCDIKNSVFRGNGQVIFVSKKGASYNVNIINNFIFENKGIAIAVGGKNVKLRTNIVKDNDGHGVYITEGAADLGTLGDPGGNTFAGNKSGYDVYNASPDNIPAYGNTWDPLSEAEMKGKTWRDVNVTRIYDHWDNPNVGYVMWNEPVGVAPASLGQIKASFKGAPTPGQLKVGPSTADN